MKKYLTIGIEIGIGIGIISAFGLFFFGLNWLRAQVVTDIAVPGEQFQTYTFFASSTVQTDYATTTSATSTDITAYFASDGRKDNGYFLIAGAEEVTVYFQRGDTTGQGNIGTSTFFIQASPDGTNWYDYNKLIDNVTNANSQNLTRVGSVIFSAAADYNNATATKAYSLSPEDAWYAIRCIVVEGTDGEHTCKASAKW